MRFLIAAIVLLQVGLATARAAEPPQLRRVILSTGGVGYFEYEAAVDGDGQVTLDVPLGQIDDLLKSLVVLDPNGTVASVTLPGRDDTNQAFGGTPFAPEALNSPIAYLNALRGTEITVQGAKPMTGRILRAETVQQTTGTQSQPRTIVTLLGPDGLQQFILEDANSVQVADPSLRARINRALEALRTQATRAVRPVTIHLSGKSQRTVAIGYVAGAPLWKATYRLVLDHDAPTGRLQAWATLENESGADWNGVSLTLQYGNPVAFRQALYRSYFVQRPEVPVEVLGHVLPDIDTRARALPMMESPAPAPPPAMMPSGAMMAAKAAVPEPPPPSAVEETGEETIFTLPKPIDLPAGHSLDVPILDEHINTPRIGLVPFEQPHPLTAVKLTNDSPGSLPAGVITVYDSSPAGPTFAGDARLGGLPAGQTRLLSYASDLRTDIETKQSAQPDIVTSVSIVNGVLTYNERTRQAIQITMTAPAQESRDLLLELPRGGLNQTLSFEDGKTTPAEQTATAWRIAVSLKPKETRILTAYLDQPTSEDVALVDGDETVIAFVAGQDRLNPAARAAIRKVLDLRQDEASKTAAAASLRKQMNDVLTDQDRLRKNLAAVTQGDALRTRLVQALDASETQAEQLRKAISAADGDAAKAHKALTDAVAALHI
jgi:hypothetical protein